MKATPQRTLSLRARLTLIILCPLMLIALAVGYWAYRDAQTRAAERFDLSLLSTVLAISRDTALSGGDALSPETRDLLRDTSGGSVYYHVYAPDGVYVTGYATPPVPKDGSINRAEQQTFFDANYRGVPVRALRFTDIMTFDGLSGQFTFTVWQEMSVLRGFVESLSRQTFFVISTLLLALALIVWFGVRIGLTPLLDLQTAIARRSSDDLAPIQRAVPAEVKGIVGTLNSLLMELAATLRAKDEFISNAAHQLRNPIAGVLSMSEAVRSATTLQDAQERSETLVDAARETAQLTNALLAFERAKSPKPREALSKVSLQEVIQAVAERTALARQKQDVELITKVPDDPLLLMADPVLLEEAILNLVTNALVHGGKELSTIHILAERRGGAIALTITDNGIGLRADQVPLAISRFGQVRATGGSGLGLPIAQAVVEGIGGQFDVDAAQDGLCIRLELPLSD